MPLSLGFSPCPNDCFMFDAIVHERIDLEGLSFTTHLADVEALNREAFAGTADVTKLSYHAYAYCRSSYELLDSGSALGRNCGPLLISARPIAPDEVRSGRLRIAIPGVYTTANFLLGLGKPAEDGGFIIAPTLAQAFEQVVLAGRQNKHAHGAGEHGVNLNRALHVNFE